MKQKGKASISLSIEKMVEDLKSELLVAVTVYRNELSD